MTNPFDRILAGLGEAAEHARGVETPGLELHVPVSVDVAAVRRRTDLSQIAFSRRIGVSAATPRNWEQGRRTHEGPGLVLLALLERNPGIVEETLF